MLLLLCCSRLARHVQLLLLRRHLLRQLAAGVAQLHLALLLLRLRLRCCRLRVRQLLQHLVSGRHCCSCNLSMPAASDSARCSTVTQCSSSAVSQASTRHCSS